MKNLQNKALWVVVSVLGLASLVGVVSAYSGGTPKVVVEGDYIEAGQSEGLLGGSYTSEPTWLTASDDWQAINSIYGYGDVEIDGTLYVDGPFVYKETVESVTSNNTLTVDESGKTIYLSGATSTQTLPAVTTAGQVFRFVVGASITGNVTIVTSDASNIIEGTLIVAGAVVDCDAEDTLTFVADGENLGDFVELRSNGTNWFIGASGALTGSKLTCSAT